MPRPNTNEYGPFYKTYIDHTKGHDYTELVQQHNDRIVQAWSAVPIQKVDFAYAPGKWTVRQMLQHVIDTERILAYRALAISREEPHAIAGFDENKYAAIATASDRNWDEMILEWQVVRQSTNMLFASFTKGQIQNMGVASDNPISVNALGFIIIGHALHHLGVLHERYSL
ncbi:MAG: DinB family protein [Flavobacteriaceae bacterium]|nr:DinB family protein [Flavobacteriaceae bacterium]MDG1962397.1 DinB family protein [Flavobacteriaceae bacterium]